MTATKTPVGRIVEIWRYPVKSMMGEELNATEVTAHGLLGDRRYALIDSETGKVASAKNPRRWPNLFEFRAAYLETLSDSSSLPPVRITLPDGQIVTADQPDADSRLSAAAGRTVRVARSTSTAGSNTAMAEGYWPDHDWLPDRDRVFEFPLPDGTFFDCATVHLITTATLERLAVLAPGSRFEVRRFRPNFVIESAEEREGFVENSWIGKTLSFGGTILHVDAPCVRCIMTTLSQGRLPKDPSVLRTAVQSNQGNVGVYASVLKGGRVRRGDSAALT
jgi:uncharacterized protein YcbX